MNKKTYKFVETLAEGQISRLTILGGIYHAARLDSQHIFGVVELDLEQAKTIDSDSDITLLPMNPRKQITESKNPNLSKLQEHIIAMKAYGVVETDTADDVAEKMASQFGNPFFT